MITPLVGVQQTVESTRDELPPAILHEMILLILLLQWHL